MRGTWALLVRSLQAPVRTLRPSHLHQQQQVACLIAASAGTGISLEGEQLDARTLQAKHLSNTTMTPLPAVTSPPTPPPPPAPLQGEARGESRAEGDMGPGVLMGERPGVIITSGPAKAVSAPPICHQEDRCINSRGEQLNPVNRIQLLTAGMQAPKGTNLPSCLRLLLALPMQAFI
jgi:hypothetical protein